MLLRAAAIILFLVLIMLSCQRPEEIAEQEGLSRALLDPLVLPRLDEALITFLSGDVFVGTGGSWEPAEIGNSVSQGFSIKAEEDSFCELQFASVAVVRILENTVLDLSGVFNILAESNTRLTIDAGSVLAKVQQLASGESFSVITDSAAIGVRGTEFWVARELGGVRVAVKDGVVAVVPWPVDLEGLRRGSGSRTELLDFLQQVEEQGLEVTEEQELFLEDRPWEDSRLSFEEFEGVFEEAMGAATVTDQMRADMNRSLEEALRLGEEAPAAVGGVSEETREKLDIIDAMRFLSFPAAEPDAVERQFPDLVKVALEATPEDSEILFNGTLVGRGRIAGVFDPGESLAFVVRREGYIEQSLSLTTEKGLDVLYRIDLERAEASIQQSEEETQAEEEAAAEQGVEEGQEGTAPEAEVGVVEPGENLIAVSVRVSPEDSEIWLEGSVVAKGSFSGSFAPGTSLSFLITRQEYEEQELDIEAVDGSGHSFEIALLPKPIPRAFQIGDAGLTGEILLEGEDSVALDRTGTLILADAAGNIRFKTPTGMTVDANSIPAVIRKKVFLVGESELVVVDLLSGEIVTRIGFAAGSDFPFGRRVVQFQGKGLFPENDRLMIFDPETGEIVKDIQVPDGATMTPMAFGKWLLIVNTKGLLLLVDEEGNYDSIIPTGAFVQAAVAGLVDGNTAYLAGSDGSAAAIDLDSRGVRWERKLPGEEDSSVYQDIQVEEEGLYILSMGMLHGLSRETGEPLFEPVGGLSAPPLVDNRWIYYGTQDRRFVVADNTTGEVSGILPLETRITTRPRSFNGRILAGTDSGSLLVIDPQAIR
jgi:outer membrane protein assembly factor BamB